MTTNASTYAARLIRLYLEHPDTPATPSSADWEVAQDLDRAGVPLDTMRLAIRIAFVRRRLRTTSSNLPPVKSLAYYRTVASNLTTDERLPEYVAYIDQLFEQLQSHATHPLPHLSSENRAR